MKRLDTVNNNSNKHKNDDYGYEWHILIRFTWNEDETNFAGREDDDDVD